MAIHGGKSEAIPGGKAWEYLEERRDKTLPGGKAWHCLEARYGNI